MIRISTFPNYYYEASNTLKHLVYYHENPLENQSSQEFQKIFGYTRQNTAAAS